MKKFIIHINSSFNWLLNKQMYVSLKYEIFFIIFTFPKYGLEWNVYLNETRLST